MNPGNWVSSVILCLENVTVLACYIFNYHEPMLILLAGNSCEVYVIISLFNFSCSFSITPFNCCKFATAKITHFWHHLLFVNMPFTKNYKFVYVRIQQCKESFLANMEHRQCLQVVTKATGYWLGQPSSRQQTTMQRPHCYCHWFYLWTGFTQKRLNKK